MAIAKRYVESAFADSTKPFNTILGVYDTAIVLKVTVGPGTATVERSTLGYFGGFETSVSYFLGSGAVPIDASHDVIGSVIGREFAGPVPGQVETLVVYTNGSGFRPARNRCQWLFRLAAWLYSARSVFA